MAETLQGHTQQFPPDPLSNRQTHPLKTLPDSGYASLVDTTYKPEDAGAQDISPLPSASSNNSNASFNAAKRVIPTLRHDSSGSVMSIPVTGGLPYGSLRVVQPATKTSNCLANGDAFLIIGGLPPNFTVGCDGAAITTTGKVEFHGFRDLPPGPHFVWVSAPGAMTRSGYWFVTGDKAVARVVQWDAYNEVLGEPASRFEANEAKENVDGVRDRLLPYGSVVNGEKVKSPITATLAKLTLEDDKNDVESLWSHLTDCVTETLLRRVTSRQDGAAEFLFDTTDTVKGEVAAGLFPFSAARATGPSAGLVKSTFSNNLAFLFPPNEIDESDTVANTNSETSILGLRTGSLTQKSNPLVPSLIPHDEMTTAISTVLSFSTPRITESDIVGEFQLAFLTALHLCSPACAAHWWRLLLYVFLRAHDLITERPGLASHILDTLKAQMEYAEAKVDVAGSDDKFDDLPAGNGATYALEFFSAMAEANSSGGGYDLNIGGKRAAQEEGKSVKLRSALAKYKRRLDDVLLDTSKGKQGPAKAELATVGKSFRELEGWFWRLNWDLRHESGDLQRSSPDMIEYIMRKNEGLKGRSNEENDDDEYAPVVVQIDEKGKEVGLVNWD